MKFFQPEEVISGTVELGFSVHHILPLGILGLVSILLYAYPHTSLLGGHSADRLLGRRSSHTCTAGQSALYTCPVSGISWSTCMGCTLVEKQSCAPFASGFKGKQMTKPRIYTMSFARIYPLYVAKAEKKGRTKEEVDQIIRWLTGYSQNEVEEIIDNGTDLETFFANAPEPNSSRKLITGVICGVRVEEIEEPIMQEIRYLDKLAKGKAMEKILRQ